jgi:hypothetical protein
MGPARIREILERKWSVSFGGLTYGRKGLAYYSDLAELSPDYSLEDVAAIDKGAELSLPRLLPYLLNFDYTNVTRFDCLGECCSIWLRTCGRWRKKGLR